MKAAAGREKIVFLILAVTASLLYFSGIGDRSFRNPDEGRYAEIASQMARTGRWLEPQLYEIDYLRKPPLYYWLLAFSFKCLGYHEASARLVPALFGVLGILLTYFFTRRVFGEGQAVYASLVLLVNFWYMQVSRYLVIDAVFCFFVTASIFCFYLARRESEHRRIYNLLFFLSVGLAFLTKGFLGFVFPGLAFLVYAGLSRRPWELMKQTFHLPGPLLLVAVVLPWPVYMASHKPDFWGVFFVREHLQRLSSGHFEHQEPWFFYPVLMAGFLFPWTFFFAPIVSAFKRKDSFSHQPSENFLLATAAAIILFLSLSRSKLPTYILPAIPLISIWIGCAWASWVGEETSGGRGNTASKITALGLLFFGFVFLVGWPAISRYLPARLPGIDEALIWLAGCIIIGSVMGLRSLQRGRRAGLFFALVLMMAMTSFPIYRALGDINAEYTTKPFAEFLKSKLSPDDKVYLYDHPGVFYDFRFYLDHPVKLVGLEGEFEIVASREGLRDRALTRDELFAKMKNSEKFYCLIRRSDFNDLSPEQKRGLKVLYENQRKILFESGHPA